MKTSKMVIMVKLTIVTKILGLLELPYLGRITDVRH